MLVVVIIKKGGKMNECENQKREERERGKSECVMCECVNVVVFFVCMSLHRVVLIMRGIFCIIQI